MIQMKASARLAIDPADRGRLLASDGADDYRGGIPFAPVGVSDHTRGELATRATSRHKDERQAVAASPAVPLGVQAMLASDDVHAVRATLARNPAAARSVLENLASDKHRDVILALLENPLVPQEIVEKLTQDRRDDVRIAAARRLTETIHRPPQTPGPDAHIPELMERAEILVPGFEYIEEPRSLPTVSATGSLVRQTQPASVAAPQASAPTVVSPVNAGETARGEQPGAESLASILAPNGTQTRETEYLPQEPVESDFAPPEWLYAELPPIDVVPGPYVAAVAPLRSLPTTNSRAVPAPSTGSRIALAS